MRLQLEITNASDGLTVRAVYPSNRCTALLFLVPGFLAAIILLLLSNPDNRAVVCVLALIPLGMGVSPAYYRWVGVDAMFRIADDHLLSRQPCASSREVSYGMENIGSIGYWKPWGRRGISGLYASDEGFRLLGARVCLIPHLKLLQCMEVSDAVAQYRIKNSPTVGSR